MKLVHGTTTIADSADLSRVPRDFSASGDGPSVDVSRPIGAPIVELFTRGHRSVRCSVTVDYGFASYEEAVLHALCVWNALNDQDDLTIVCGDTAVLLADAVLAAPEVVGGSLTEAACLVRWSWQGAQFEASDPSDLVTSIFTRQTIAVSSAATTTITLNVAHRASTLLVQASAGTYTHKVALPVTSRQNGDTVFARIELPDDATTVVEVRDTDGSGTLLATFTGIADGATNYVAQFTFNGTAWVLTSSAHQ